VTDLQLSETRTPGKLGLNRTALVLTILALVSAVITIWIEMADAGAIIYIFKPLTTILILLIAATGQAPPSAAYQRTIVVGLVFSLIGDVLLVLPGDLFLPGLVSFLVAQICYTIAFVRVGGFYRSLLAFVPFLALGLVMIAIYWPNLDGLTGPVFIYMMAILIMAWQALGQWRQTGERRALLAFVGALFFVASDATLALNRFGYPFASSPVVVLGTYYLGQWLIALSAGAVAASSPQNAVSA
jgi:uncharacterized membrane protein YhhN